MVRNILNAIIYFLILFLIISCKSFQTKDPNHAQLLMASSKGNLEEVKKSIAKGIPVNVQEMENGNTAILLATKNKKEQLEIVKFLFEKGANISYKNKQGQNALSMAKFHGHKKSLAFLEKKIVIINGDLLQGGPKGDLKKVEWAVQRGADVNQIRKNGFPLIVSVAGYGFWSMVKILLENGVDVNAVNPEGRSALMVSAMIGSTRIVKLLLNHKAEVNIKSKDGVTALSSAKVFRRKKIIELLQAAGAR